MGRFLIWAGEAFYAHGPINDFVGDFDSVENGLAAMVSRAFDWPWKRGEVYPDIFDNEGEILVPLRDHPKAEWIRALDTQDGRWLQIRGHIYGEDDPRPGA